MCAYLGASLSASKFSCFPGFSAVHHTVSVLLFSCFKNCPLNGGMGQKVFVFFLFYHCKRQAVGEFSVCVLRPFVHVCVQYINNDLYRLCFPMRLRCVYFVESWSTTQGRRLKTTRTRQMVLWHYKTLAL